MKIHGPLGDDGTSPVWFIPASGFSFGNQKMLMFKFTITITIFHSTFFKRSVLVIHPNIPYPDCDLIFSVHRHWAC